MLTRSVHALMRQMGARAVVGLSFFLLGLLLFVATGLLSGLAARKEAERASSELLMQGATRLADRLDAGMAERLHEVRRLAETESIAGLGMSAAQWRLTLDRLQQSVPEYSWIGLASPDGIVMAATQGMLEGVDVRGRPWFPAGKVQPSVLDVHEARLLSKLLPQQQGGEPHRFMDVVAPVRQGERLIGVLGAHLNWTWAEQQRQRLLATLDARSQIEVTLFDRKGQVVLGARQPTLPPDQVQAAMQVAGARVQRWSDGREYLAVVRASRPEGDYPGMGWVVVVRQPVDVAYAAANRLQHQIWMFGALGAALFGVVGWWLADRLTLPLRRMAEQAQGAAPAAADSARNEVDLVAQSLTALIRNLKSSELQIGEFNQRLEDAVHQRTQALEEANASLQGFTSGVSHDLRSPLGQMSTLLQLTLENEGAGLTDTVRRRLGLAVQETARLRALCDEYLDLAVAQQREIHPEPVSMDLLVSQVLAEVRGGWGGATLPEVKLGALPDAQGDPVLLRQVWFNLLSNAFKYSAKVGQPRVEISGLVREGETIYTVADNGVGFDPAQADKLFAAFQRLHAQADFAGVGVGLAIVKQVVQRHGGSVWAESAPGCGARFHFALPLVPADGHAEPRLGAQSRSNDTGVSA